jgi:hypothetical protein
MKATLLVVAVVVLQGASAALALERIKKKPPTPAETERIASEEAMNDGTLQKGDIVRTDRGFFVYCGNWSGRIRQRLRWRSCITV